MIVRPATPSDIPAMAAVLEANGETDSLPDVPGRPYLEHLVSRPSARPLAGEVDGVVVGWGATIEVGGPRRRFITDLFIDPAQQSKGVGRAVLAQLVDGADQRFTFSSDDPRALGAYVRARMRPWWPVLYMTVSGAALPEVGEGAGAESVTAEKICTADEIVEMQRLARAVPIAPHVTAYAVSVLAATHPDHPRAPGIVRDYVRYGGSPRGAQALVTAGKIYALLDGRFNVAIDDIRAVALPSLRHRIILNFEGEAEGITTEAVVRAILDAVVAPTVE